jgi:hypothetical protein
VVDTLDLALQRPATATTRYGFVFADLRAHGRDRVVPADAGARHRERFRGLVMAAARRHGALDLTSVGDGYFLVLPGPKAAVRCARSIVTAAARPDDGEEALRVAAGVHAADLETGTAGPHDGAGRLAARIGAVTPSGEVHVTATVVDQVGRTAGLRFEPRALPPLKGLSSPPAVFAAVEETGSVPATARVIRVLAMGTLAGLLSLAVMVGSGGVRPALVDDPLAGGTMIASPPVDLALPVGGGVGAGDPDGHLGPAPSAGSGPSDPLPAPLHIRSRFR